MGRHRPSPGRYLARTVIMDEEKTEQLTNLLKELKPGFLPYPVFEQVARLVALPILELVPYRVVADRIEVLLLERPENDPIWPNMWHAPGTVIRATDLNAQTHDLRSAFDRLVHDELMGVALGPTVFVASVLHESKRGAEQAQIYCSELLEEPKNGKLFAVDSLPEQFMAHQQDFINLVARKVKENTGVTG